MTPNLAAVFATHKTVILGAGIGGAALLGLRARAKMNAGAANSSGGGVTATTAAPQLVPQGAYDSTANDVYNAIEPQIEALNSQLSALAAGPTTVPTTQPAAPVPAPTPSYTAHVPVGAKWGGYFGSPATAQPPQHFYPLANPNPPIPSAPSTPVHTSGSWGTTGPKA